MTTLSSDRLLALLVAATGGKPTPSDKAPKPALLDIPDIGPVRIYLWTTTPDQSVRGRPAGEHKSQIILPGTPRGSKQHLDLEEMPTFLLGFSPLYGVFASWEARLHQNAGYSKNLQIKEDLLEEGSVDGWAIDEPRHTSAGAEIRAAIHPAHLKRFLKVSIMADVRGLEGKARRVFLLAHAPELDALDLGNQAEAGQTVALEDVQRARVAVTGSRLKRYPGFAKRILSQFEFQCAICELQLTILDGAHIIPVHDSKSTDEDWNGLSLCKNHHRLFDKRIVTIDKDMLVRVEDGAIDLLRDLGQLGGYAETIGAFRNKPVRKLPNYFGVDSDLTRRMRQALDYNFKLTAA